MSHSLLLSFFPCAVKLVLRCLEDTGYYQRLQMFIGREWYHCSCSRLSSFLPGLPWTAQPPTISLPLSCVSIPSLPPAPAVVWSGCAQTEDACASLSCQVWLVPWCALPASARERTGKGCLAKNDIMDLKLQPEKLVLMHMHMLAVVESCRRLPPQYVNNSSLLLSILSKWCWSQNGSNKLKYTIMTKQTCLCLALCG